MCLVLTRHIEIGCDFGDGFHLDVAQGESIPPKAVVRFEAVTLMVDERMKWEKAKSG